jgi:polyisoprenoid-binding protein YceI
MNPKILILLLAVMPAHLFGSDQACVIAGQGYFRIHVGTAGLFGGFAHDHFIEAQKIVGCATIDPGDITRSSIRLEFPTADIRVIDPKESEKDRAEVQKTMEAQVLHVAEYPRVIFESTGVERVAGAPDRFRVRGNLTIRGKTLPVIIPVTVTRLANGSYHAVGEYSFKQSSFLIRPIQLAGGTVKVKDELDTKFELDLK